MAYVPNCEWDIFISYAEADNQASGRSKRWITLFHDHIRREVNLIKGDVKIFYANRSHKAYESLNNIFNVIRESALFLVIGSPSWVKSEEWCLEELRSFLKYRDSSRIFIAEFDPPVEDLTYPPELPDNLRRHFWKLRSMQVPMPLTPGDALFEETLKLLARDIRERLRALKNEFDARQVDKGDEPAVGPVEKPEVSLAPKIYRGKKVFVARGRADLRIQRDEVIAYLKSMGVTIAQPVDPASHSLSEFQQSVKEGLRGADAYVHLLGAEACEPCDGADESPTYLQLSAATDRGLTRKDIFLWIPDELVPKNVSDARYRKCLGDARNGSHVPDLATAVLGKLATDDDPGPDPNAPLSLVINADPEDRAQARELIRACSDRRCRVILDKFSLNEVARKEWLNADAVAYVHGKSPEEWLAARYHEFNKERANKGLGEPKGQVIIYAPPPPKEPGDVGGDYLKELDLSTNWSVEPFRAWLDEIGVPLTVKD